MDNPPPRTTTPYISCLNLRFGLLDKPPTWLGTALTDLRLVSGTAARHHAEGRMDEGMPLVRCSEELGCVNSSILSCGNAHQLNRDAKERSFA